MSEETKIKRNGKKVLIGGLIVVVLVVVAIVIGSMTIFSVNRSPKAVAKATFESIYSCKYNRFVKATIYNPDFQSAMDMDLSADLKEIEPEFEAMREWMDQTGETYKVTKVVATEYDALHEKYQEGIELFKEAYYGVLDSQIEKVAVADIEYEVRYRDESDEWVTLPGTELYWCYEIEGKWYSFPMLGAVEE